MQQHTFIFVLFFQLMPWTYCRGAVKWNYLLKQAFSISIVREGVTVAKLLFWVLGEDIVAEGSGTNPMQL